MTRLVKLGKGFSFKGDKITDHRHKLGDKSAQIRRAKSKKSRVVSPAKARMAMKVYRP